jgi:hypothetical protein
MKLMTNSPAKYSGLKGYGLSIAGRVPLVTPITSENRKYLETKRTKMGHVYGLANAQVNQPSGSQSTEEKHWAQKSDAVFFLGVPEIFSLDISIYSFFLYFHIFFLSHRRPFCSSTVAVGFKMVNEPNKSKFNNISNCSCKELYSLSYIADMYNG